MALAIAGRRVWETENHVRFALFIGLLGWFAQGTGEFGLYIPALAWTAFTLLGCVLALTEIGSTNPRRPDNLPKR